MRSQPCSTKYVELSLLFSLAVHFLLYLFVGNKTQIISHPRNTTRNIILETLCLLFFFPSRLGVAGDSLTKSESIVNFCLCPESRLRWIYRRRSCFLHHYAYDGKRKKKQHDSCISTPFFVDEVHFGNLQTSDLDSQRWLKYLYLNDASYT